MFRFEHLTHLYALAAIPVLTLFFYLTRRNRARDVLKFGQFELVRRLMPQVSLLKHPLKFGILMVAFLFLVVAWANPQWGTKRERAKRRASDVIIALDISNSMLADDVKPSRLERARAFALDLANALKGERIGFVEFAGNAYLQTPLTTDYAAASMFIKSANPTHAPTQGTALADAIDISEKTFGTEAKNHKVLVIISDGEDHDSDAIERAKEAHDNGLLIFTIGVGTTEGGMIPFDFGNGLIDFKRDDNGQPVKSKVNEKMLTDLANAAEGAYFNLSATTNVIDALKNRVDKVEKKELEARSFSEFESYFQWFLAIALLILVAEFMMPYRKSDWEEKDIFKI
jgi:Ca-activated chloride channel homolog